MPALAKACLRNETSAISVSLRTRVRVVVTYRVRIKTLKQIHHLLEEIAHFLLRGVVGVAAGVDGVDASAVLTPLVSPEGLVVAVDVDPVLLHVGQEIGATLLG